MPSVLKESSHGIFDPLRRAAPRRVRPVGSAFKAKLAVIQSLKGKPPVGDSFEAETSHDEPPVHACPLVLKAGKSYLLFLRYEGSALVLERYHSWDGEVGDVRTDAYVREIAAMHLQ